MNEHQIKFTYLSQEDLIQSGAFDLPLAINVAEKAMLDFEQHKILFPEKIVQIFNPASQERINCLPATLLEEKVCGVKWVSVFPRNPSLNDAQNLSAIFVLSEIEKGFPIAVLEGTLASNMRVAAVGAIAAKHLALENSQTIGFIGAGEQAKMHLLAMKVVRPTLTLCRVSDMDGDAESQFIKELAPLLPDVTFEAANTHMRAAMDGADILVTATSDQSPLLKADWMKPGAFYSHVGGWEDEYEVAQQCDKIVCDDWKTVTHRTQTLSRMFKEGLISSANIHADLHELVSGHKPGRQCEQERIYFNAVGLAFLDVAIALAMYKRALSRESGTELNLQSSMIFEHSDIASDIRL